MKDCPDMKKKRLRLYRQLAKFNQALKDPEHLVRDPAEETERINKRRERKLKKLQTLAQKHKAQELATFKTKTVVCINCKERGHVMKDCPSLDKREVYCYSCGSRSHTYKQCTDSGFAHAVCFFCNQTGHLAKHCTQKHKSG